jgi:hypothetical protein
MGSPDNMPLIEAMWLPMNIVRNEPDGNTPSMIASPGFINQDTIMAIIKSNSNNNNEALTGLKEYILTTGSALTTEQY